MPIDTSLDFTPINIAVITISDTRTTKNDTSGDILEKRINDSGHRLVKRVIVADDVKQIKETLKTKQVCYWSRSRKKLWRKGESSGHVQRLVEFRFDCDKDTILMMVDQTGPACHTNRPNCFYNSLTNNGVEIISEPIK